MRFKSFTLLTESWVMKFAFQTITAESVPLYAQAADGVRWAILPIIPGHRDSEQNGTLALEGGIKVKRFFEIFLGFGPLAELGVGLAPLEK